MKIFCLPYAGGSAVIYKEWIPFFPADLKMTGIEYAGHGNRSNQPLYKDVEEAITDVYNIILKQISDGLPYAIFGHSMGAMLAFEVVKKLRTNNQQLPVHIFFSGRGAPHIKSK